MSNGNVQFIGNKLLCSKCSDGVIRINGVGTKLFCDCELGLRARAQYEYQCALCTFVTQNEKEFHGHFEHMHRGTERMPDLPTWTCDRCGYISHNEIAMRQHFAKEHAQEGGSATGVRDVASETTKVQTGNSKAVSSKEALYYHLISPSLIRRLALRKTVGGKKYGQVQWRQGINDREYVRDRFNHLWEHLLKFMESGNTKDDNIGGMVWALDCLSEVERLCPESFKSIVGTCDLFGESAEVYHNEEMERRNGK